ncbi:hypothetical protein DCC81_10440 [Chitinophaga parva]|uniref:FecR family protein n=1 Tax=Chitinophaga parva TaxID=2169414 RepID=A0A2T7BEP3_9BACT|nr:FecR domain-containing protein [Chitinophaga parva]PUZ24751.1 hypothetical protein DCC81_10440 [Chitinophaga parva]
MQQIPDEQIEKFLQGQCDPAEAAAVAEYLQQHPEHPLLREAWAQTDGETALAGNASARMRAYVHTHTRPRKAFMYYVSRAAIAASLAIVVALGYNRFTQPATPVAQQAIKPAVKPAPAIQWAGLINRKGTPQQYTLPDSSVAILYPGSYIRYPLHMGRSTPGSNTRDVYLEGKGQFKVARNAGLPFTAYAKGIGVTALGTTFTLTTQQSSTTVRVQLLEGRVVVRSSQRNARLQAIYLHPGQECVVDDQLSNVQVTRSAGSSTIEVPKAPSTGNEGMALQPLSFSGERLDQVFDRIGRRFGVKIEYAQAGADQLAFTGTFLPTDDLETIINVICNIDDLTYQWQDNRIIIKKSN